MSLLCLNVLMGLMMAQQPPAPTPPATPWQKVVVGPPVKVVTKPAPKTVVIGGGSSSPLEEKIIQALQNHPDLAVAKAEVALAQAKLEQERQRIVLKITLAQSAVEAARAMQESVAQENAQIQRTAPGAVPHDEIKRSKEQLIQANQALLAAEATLKAAIGVSESMPARTLPWTGAFTPLVTYRVVTATENGVIRNYYEAVPIPNAPAPPPAVAGGTQTSGSTDLREMLQSRAISNAESHSIMLELLNQQNKARTALTNTSFPGKLAEVIDKPLMPKTTKGIAADILRELVPGSVRIPSEFDPKLMKSAPSVELLGTNLTLAAWLQQWLDIVNESASDTAPYQLYIREYGLLLARQDKAPRDALPLGVFVEQVEARKAAMPATPAPKPAIEVELNTKPAPEPTPTPKK